MPLQEAENGWPGPLAVVVATRHGKELGTRNSSRERFTLSEWGDWILTAMQDQQRTLITFQLVQTVERIADQEAGSVELTSEGAQGCERGFEHKPRHRPARGQARCRAAAQ